MLFRSYREAAASLGALLAREDITVVYGGATVGLMGTVADAALATGGRVVGVIPEALVAREIAHPGLTELHVVGSMHERKARMAELAEGFIALPGGFGTLEEFCEVLTWSQLSIHRKPCGLLNVAGYYANLLQLFDHAVAEQLLKPAYRQYVLSADDPAELLALMQSYEPAAGDKWIRPDET